LQKLNFLEALRGYAILGVVFTHVAQKIPELDGWLYNFGIQGARGVQLFFIVSAFTLFYTLHRKYENSDRINLVEFYSRRFFRIAPMFYTAFIVYAVFEILTFKLGLKSVLSDYSISMILSTLSFTSVLNPEWLFSLVPGGWSISVEVLFYLLIPILFRVIRNFKVSLIITIFVSVLCWLLNVAVVQLQLIDTKYIDVKYLFYWFPNQLPIFLIGITFFYFWRDYKIKFNNNILLVASLLLILLLSVTGHIYNPMFPKHIIFGVAFALFALSLSKLDKSFFNHKLMVFLGKVSFSVYLVHFMILDIVNELLMKRLIEFIPTMVVLFVVFAITLGLSIIIAHVSYKMIEEPGIKLGRILTTNRSIAVKNSKTG